MKIVSKIAFVGILIGYSVQSFACAPAFNPVGPQLGDLDYILGSEEFRTTLQNSGMNDRNLHINNISFKDGFINIEFNNFCYIQTKVKYKASDFPGMCPSRDGVQTEIFCAPMPSN